MVRVGIGAVLAMVVAGPVAGYAANDVTLHSVDTLGLRSPTVQAVAHMDKLLRDRSHGHLRIESYGEGNPSTDTFKVSQVRNGLIEMARVNLGVVDSLVTPTGVLSLPYLFKSRAHFQHVLDGPIGEGLLASLEKINLIGLCYYDLGARSLYGTTAVRSPAEMRGLVVRVPLSTTAAMIVRSLGAVPAPMPNYQVNDAMRTGAVNLSVNTLSTYFSDKQYAEAHFFSATEHARVPGVLVFSKPVWDRLSAADRRLLRETARESAAFEREQLDAYEAEAERTAEAAGARFVRDVDRAAFAAALRPHWPKILPAPDTEGLIARIEGDPEVAHLPSDARPK
jgi:tripartite ATP-independent transporter DctP family solute receptor